MHTEVNLETGRVLVISDIPDTDPQAFTVCVKNPEDWEEIHNYIINDNEIDGIPNRRIECRAEMPFSTKRSVYEMSVEEANILRSHPKIEWVEESSMYNEHVLEQRKLDEPFDRHTSTNRYKQNVVNRRISGDPTPVDNTLLNFTQWGIHRHQFEENPFVGIGATTLQADSQYTLTGKNVDVVIMDTGVRWDHPEFLKPGYTSVVGVATTVASRVRDILIHGQSEYGIDWASEGLTPPGLGILANYTIANVLESSTFNGSWHGSHCAGTAAGNQFGLAFEANIWSIACVDRSDVGWGEPSDGFDYIRMWHKNKPINPETGRKNPTIVNCSWGHRQFVSISGLSTATYRGTTYSSPYTTPAISNISDISYSGIYYEFTAKKITGQTTMDELLNDPECQDIILVCAAGNSGDTNGKQDLSGGADYNNQFLSGVYYESGYDNYYNRSGTPAIGHQGRPDAVIIVGALDSLLATTDSDKERLSYFSNRGPAIDVFAAGSTILSPYDSGYYDPRNFSYFNGYLSGTSMATPNAVGVISLYLESNPKANRINVRNWLLDNATKTAPLSNLYTDDSVSTYWSNNYALRGSNPRVLFNPYANNESPKVEGITASGISFTQS